MDIKSIYKVESKLKWLNDLFLWLILNINLIEVDFEEIKKKKYKHIINYSHQIPNSFKENSVTIVKEWIGCLLESAKKRKQSLDDKVRVVLTLSTLAIPIIITNFTMNSAFVFYTMSLVSFFTTVILILSYFRVEISSISVLSEQDFSLEKDKIEIELMKSDLKCYAEDSVRIDFMADIFRASRRSFLLGLIFLGFGFFSFKIHSIDSVTKNTKSVLELIKQDKELFSLIKGPQGAKGDVGPKGPVGERGLDGSCKKEKK